MGVPRKVVQIAAAASSGESRLFALADDGTVWLSGNGDWLRVIALPEAEACGAYTRDLPDQGCQIAKGHRGHHWSGSRKWA